MEALCGRIILKSPGKGVGELSGRIAKAEKELCCCNAALHAALPCHEDTADFLILRKPVGRNHAAYIHDDNYAPEAVCDLADQLLFAGRQIEVTACKKAILQTHQSLVVADILTRSAKLGLAVPSLAGKTADGDDGGIADSSCLIGESIRKLRLLDHSRNSACLILGGYIVVVEGGSLLPDRNQVFIFMEAVIQILHIRNRDIAGSAAAFYIVKGSLAEKCKAASFGKRKNSRVIFQKNHALSGSISGKCDMLPGSRNAPIAVQGQIRLVICSGPFAHSALYPSDCMCVFMK